MSLEVSILVPTKVCHDLPTSGDVTKTRHSVSCQGLLWTSPSGSPSVSSDKPFRRRTGPLPTFLVLFRPPFGLQGSSLCYKGRNPYLSPDLESRSRQILKVMDQRSRETAELGGLRDHLRHAARRREEDGPTAGGDGHVLRVAIRSRHPDEFRRVSGLCTRRPRRKG